MTTDQVRSAIARVHSEALGAIGLDAGTDGVLGRLDSPPPLTGPYQSTGSAKDLFQRARRLAAADKRGMLRTGHITMAAAEAEHGTVARLLQLLDIDRPRLAGAARAAVAS